MSTKIQTSPKLGHAIRGTKLNAQTNAKNPETRLWKAIFCLGEKWQLTLLEIFKHFSKFVKLGR